VRVAGNWLLVFANRMDTAGLTDCASLPSMSSRRSKSSIAEADRGGGLNVAAAKIASR